MQSSFTLNFLNPTIDIMDAKLSILYSNEKFSPSHNSNPQMKI